MVLALNAVAVMGSFIFGGVQIPIAMIYLV
jgi:hypothetical protein